MTQHVTQRDLMHGAWNLLRTQKGCFLEYRSCTETWQHGLCGHTERHIQKTDYVHPWRTIAGCVTHSALRMLEKEGDGWLVAKK